MTSEMWHAVSGSHCSRCQDVNKSNNESSSGAYVDMWHLISGRKSTIKDKG